MAPFTKPPAADKPKIVDSMTLTNKEYAALTAQAANYRVILRFLLEGGINEYLREHNRPPIDLQLTPDDKTGGESAIFFLKSIADECNRMDQKIKWLSESLVNTTISLTQEKQKTKVYEKNSLFRRIIGFFIVLD
jgi:hypothetical protein